VRGRVCERPAGVEEGWGGDAPVRSRVWLAGVG